MKLEKTVQAISTCFLLVFIGFLFGVQTEEKRTNKLALVLEETLEDLDSAEGLIKDLEKSLEAVSIIEVIDGHIFITDINTMATLMPPLSSLDFIAGGYIGNGRIICVPVIAICQHEVGHALDDFLGHPSMTEAFEHAVESFIARCIEEDIISFFCSIKDWAGVNGNSTMTIIINDNGDTIEWGGYGELYAHIFELSHTNLLPIPESLNQFYLGDGINW